MAPNSSSAPGMAVGGLSTCSPSFEATTHARRLKPHATRCKADLRRLDEAAQAAFVSVAGDFRLPAAQAALRAAAPIAVPVAALRGPAGADDPVPAAPLEPERLALMEPSEARAALDALTPTQRVAQAVAQAARPGIGKTGLALSITHHLAVRNGHSVGIVSLEMNQEELVQRLLAIHTGVDTHGRSSTT